MPSLPRLVLAAAASAVLVGSLAACATTAPAPAETAGSPTPSVSAIGPTSTPTATSTAVAAGDLTCDTLIAADTLAQFEAQKWTSQQGAFAIGDVEYDDGIACTWGDFTVASGNVIIFGWAPIDADEATAARAALQAEGWRIEEGPDGDYLTEDPNQSLTLDENGYGMTYLFGDGWVTMADTKQNLLLIERPAS
ncbi:hypothetical protein [Microbacterium telephonicum]|uniref:LppP/LprE lipoprotein n=1 Tax=Microbacterium telephonicum TaxID=1714841 RepID=A0A498C4M4_9MICO|nr:hypothetical protein [Microbacterium telephonicum]RLK49426.1 hypothetical protein C7474_1575 [Microbacterium telephonicum]